jgi:hypothetical protein
MQRRDFTVKFLEAYDPSLKKEGTNFNDFFSTLKLGDVIHIDESFDINKIIDIAEKQYGLIIAQKFMDTCTEELKSKRLFEVRNYSEIKLTDYWYNETVRIFRDITKEERIVLMDRIYKIFCKDCMEEHINGKMACACEYGSYESENNMWDKRLYL